MDGSLILVQTVGTNLFEDDQLVLSEATRVRRYPLEHLDKKRRVEVEAGPLHYWRKSPLSGLMQRILCFLFRRAHSTGKKT
jgi:hypothetical protein